MTIPEICREPGYVFYEGIFESVLSRDCYCFKVENEDYSGEVIMEKHYSPDNVQLKSGKPVTDLVVVRYEKNRLFVAMNNYFDDLMGHFFNTDRGVFVKNIPFPNWERAWETAFAHTNYQPEKLQLKKREHRNERWIEVKSPRCRIPAHEHSHISDMDGEPVFFPASFYNIQNRDRNGRLIPRALYKTEGMEEMPCYFKGEFSPESGNTRTVHIYLHGITFPSKWHYSVLKHMICLPKFKGKDDNRDLWKAFDGEEPLEPDVEIVQACKLKCKDSCDERHCQKEKIFKNVHKKIRTACERYLRRAIIFFPQHTDKALRIWQDRKSQCGKPKFIEVDCLNKIENNIFRQALGQEELERNEILILRGYSYDWDSAEEPTIHLSIVTMYAGPLKGKMPRENAFKKDFRLTGNGKLSISEN
ncbi:hypothetical protein DENIS_1079 [Desulfonema ishimotonii]|uniref:Uncharacterized protein n=1 Tax=Desulfonema ishimotonii TaxID=45657 RepID=A0A401FT58_9BACT|nr:type III-E CRISPR-associated protein Csx31 [Desulfonema ishimotonii]GBC60134.1 hypothetical protein DENIS_1079 [Desulfonema ishimotonii]